MFVFIEDIKENGITITILILGGMEFIKPSNSNPLKIVEKEHTLDGQKWKFRHWSRFCRSDPRVQNFVKNEFEKIRREKGYDPGTHVEEILDEVAEK